MDPLIGSLYTPLREMRADDRVEEVLQDEEDMNDARIVGVLVGAGFGRDGDLT